MIDFIKQIFKARKKEIAEEETRFLVQVRTDHCWATWDLPTDKLDPFFDALNRFFLIDKEDFMDIYYRGNVINQNKIKIPHDRLNDFFTKDDRFDQYLRSVI